MRINLLNMHDGDYSHRDQSLFKSEIDRDIIETQEDLRDARLRENQSDYEVMVGYVNELKIRYDIVIPKGIMDRLRDLERFTKSHNRDARVIYEAFFQVFHLRRKKIVNPSVDLSEGDLGIGLAASLLHDIGKSGPAGATTRKREIVSRLYNLESLPNGEETPINDAVRLILSEAERAGKGENVAERLQSYLNDLKNLGIKPNDFMPSFWRAHAEWTKQILTKFLNQSENVYRRITKIASSHHYFEGNNLEHIDLHATHLSPEEQRDIYLIKLLIVLDQYQGARRRGKKEPEQAMQFIKDKLTKNGFSEDPDFLEILSLVEQVEKNTAVFKLGAELDAEVKR